MAGIAVTAAIAPYPNICYSGCDITRYLASNGIGAKNTGLIWTNEPDIAELASAVSPLDTYVLNLKLSDPAQAPAFADRYSTSSPAGPFFNTWEDLASWYGLLVQDEQAVLVPGAGSSACSRSPPWPSWSEAGWQNTPGGSGCSRPPAPRRPWSRPHSWHRTWPWR